MKAFKTILSYFLLGLRFAAGALFIYSALLKLIQPIEYFQFAIRLYEIVPESLVPWVALVMPWAELIGGIFLFMGYLSRPAAWLLVGLVGLFQIVIGQAVFRELPIEECGCFGGLVHFSPCQTYVFDSVILLALLALAFTKRHPLSLDSILLDS